MLNKQRGSYQHVYFKFKDLFEKMGAKADLLYVGRPERSSPATGSIYRHNVEQAAVIQSAFLE
jgi:2-oxoglutarate dehydrogenase E1 component